MNAVPEFSFVMLALAAVTLLLEVNYRRFRDHQSKRMTKALATGVKELTSHVPAMPFRGYAI